MKEDKIFGQIEFMDDQQIVAKTEWKPSFRQVVKLLFWRKVESKVCIKFNRTGIESIHMEVGQNLKY